MSAAQHQALVLSGVSFMAFSFFMCVVLSSRRTKFSVFAACNLLFVALAFSVVALVDFSSWRVEFAVAVMTELPVVLIVSWVCLAQVGGLPVEGGALPVEPVARRPRLRAVLATAPLMLLASLGLATAVGFILPSPAMRVYAPAPPQFFFTKGMIMAPEGFYSGLAAVVFGLVGRSSAPKRRLFFKNLAFSVGMACIALIAADSVVFAGTRVWVSGEGRRSILETLNTVETCLAICCFFAFAAGLTLRYTPAVASTLVHRLQNGWLRAQEQFESLEWRAVSSGAANRLAHASGCIVEASHLQGLSKSNMEKALATMRLVAVIKDPSAETRPITLEAARELHELQREILCDDVLASKISWASSLKSRAHEPQTVKSAPLHDALSAALDLVEQDGKQAEGRTLPPWYCLAAVSAAETNLIDSSNVLARLGCRPEYLRAVEAYREASTYLRSSASCER